LEAAVTPTVTQEDALADREPALEPSADISDQPPLGGHDAPLAKEGIPPHGGDDISDAAALVADENPPAPIGVDDPPIAERVDVWVPEPTAPSNGIAVHAVATAEYPAVDHAAPDRDVTELPTGEVNDIEVPLPAAADGSQATGADSAVMDVQFAAATELIEAPTTEPGDGLATSISAEPTVLADSDIPAEPPIEPPAPPLAAAPPPPPAAPPPEEGEEEGATMTIIEHLEELRHRITISAISIVVGAIIGWFITPHLVQYLENAFKKLGGQFLSLTILGPFGLELKLSFLIGFVIASPMVLYQIWGFVAPGLTRRERRYALPFSLIGSALFAGGALTGVLIVPLAIQFLTHFFQVLQLEQVIDIDKYIMFIALIAVIFGITFELPIFMVGFSLLGVVNSRFFIQKFRIAIFVIYGAAMVITPGADLVSPLVLGTFLIVLYWLGVLLIRVIGR
jgi:sec-independent protein translocase protein TatC